MNGDPDVGLTADFQKDEVSRYLPLLTNSFNGVLAEDSFEFDEVPFINASLNAFYFKFKHFLPNTKV